jgi:hypothetical protein
MLSQQAFVRLGGFFILLGVNTGCQRADSGPAKPDVAQPCWFREVSDEVGLSFHHDAGLVGTYFMPQSIGSGAALFDFDNDARLDIYLVQNGGPQSRFTNKLFRQTSDGRFMDVSAGSGLDVTGFGMGVAIGDVNNDGRPDVLLTEYGGIRLFLNNGNGTFTDATRAAGLENLLWGTSACFVDYDRDGWLDLVVVNYVAYDRTRPCAIGGKPDYPSPRNFAGTVTKLYRNLGRASGTGPGAARFEDVTLKSGLGRLEGPGLGVVCADFSGDRWPDIFVANDGGPNRLWINQRDGTFKEEALMRGVAYDRTGQAQANMGIALGDVDGKGGLDIFVTHLVGESHTLWQLRPPGLFEDKTARAGLARESGHGTGFGTVFADFDLDGALDLAIVNGGVSRGPPIAETRLGPYWSRYAQVNQLLRNDGAGHFHGVSSHNEAFCATPGVARGLACGDIDNDGRMDLLVTGISGPARLFRNVCPRQGHWLLVRALDPALRRDAYGAEITVHAGARQWLRLVNPGYSYLCSNDPRAHFGLGNIDQIDSVDVVWPDGTKESFPGPAVDKLVVLRKGEGNN